LKGVVTGSEWLRFRFITSGLSRIWGPSDDFVEMGLNGELDEMGDDTVVEGRGLIGVE
jgi:hypothetical protein